MLDHETAHRLVNANRAQLFGSDPKRLIAFICECGEEDCAAALLLTGREYDERVSAGGPLLHERHSAATAR